MIKNNNNDDNNNNNNNNNNNTRILNTVAPSCATTSRKRAPPINDNLDKNPNIFLSKPYIVGTSSKRLPLVCDCDNLLG